MSSGHDDWSQHDDPPRTAAAGGPLSATDGIATRTPGGSGSGGGGGIGRKTAKRDVFTGAAGVGGGGGGGSKGKSAGGSSRLTRAWKGKLAPGAAPARGGELSSLGSILRRQPGHGQASAATASAGPSSRKYGAGLPGTTRGPHRGGFGALRGIGGSAATSKGNGKAKALLGGTPDLTAGPLSSGSPWLDDESEPLLSARVPRPRKGSSTTSLFGGAGSSSSTALPRWREAFRPSAETVDAWLDSWIKRWTVLAILPSLIVG